MTITTARAFNVPSAGLCLVLFACGTFTPQASADVFGQPHSCAACANGTCVARAGTHGHYVTTWRRWPEPSPSRGPVRQLPDATTPPADVPGPLDEALIRGRTRSDEPVDAEPKLPVPPQQQPPGAEMPDPEMPDPSLPPADDDVAPFPTTPQDSIDFDTSPFSTPDIDLPAPESTPESDGDDGDGLPDFDFPFESDIGDGDTRVIPRKPLRLKLAAASATRQRAEFEPVRLIANAGHDRDQPIGPTASGASLPTNQEIVQSSYRRGLESRLQPAKSGTPTLQPERASETGADPNQLNPLRRGSFQPRADALTLATRSAIRATSPPPREASSDVRRNPLR